LVSTISFEKIVRQIDVVVAEIEDFVDVLVEEVVVDFETVVVVE
jgi:hypothetical protein